MTFRNSYHAPSALAVLTTRLNSILSSEFSTIGKFSSLRFEVEYWQCFESQTIEKVPLGWSMQKPLGVSLIVSPRLTDPEFIFVENFCFFNLNLKLFRLFSFILPGEYDLLQRNCEHFARECTEGKSYSKQVNDGLMVAAVGAVLYGAYKMLAPANNSNKK